MAFLWWNAKAPGLHIEPDEGHGPFTEIFNQWNSKTHRQKRWAMPIGLAAALNVASRLLFARGVLTGGMQRTLELTVAYAKTRKQFGKPIGIFQAVQHFCADMYLETESSRSAHVLCSGSRGARRNDRQTQLLQ